MKPYDMLKLLMFLEDLQIFHKPNKYNLVQQINNMCGISIVSELIIPRRRIFGKLLRQSIDFKTTNTSSSDSQGR